MGEIVIYQTDDGKSKLDVRLAHDTLWLSQEQMATVFGKAKSTINEHIKNIFAEGELQPELVMRKFGISEFSTKPTNLYSISCITQPMGILPQRLFLTEPMPTKNSWT